MISGMVGVGDGSGILRVPRNPGIYMNFVGHIQDPDFALAFFSFWPPVKLPRSREVRGQEPGRFEGIWAPPLRMLPGPDGLQKKVTLRSRCLAGIGNSHLGPCIAAKSCRIMQDSYEEINYYFHAFSVILLLLDDLIFQIP